MGDFLTAALHLVFLAGDCLKLLSRLGRWLALPDEPLTPDATP